MDAAKFYSSVKVTFAASQPRMERILEEVSGRLPDEEQFSLKGLIQFMTRDGAILVGNHIGSRDFERETVDGKCNVLPTEPIRESAFFITIVVEGLEKRSDDYVKGLIAHELGELTLFWKKVKENEIRLKKAGRRAKMIIIEQMNPPSIRDDPQGHQDYENKVNEEARKLGFEKEIDALERNEWLD